MRGLHMDVLLCLTKDNPRLARGEAEALLGRGSAEPGLWLGRAQSMRLVQRLAYASQAFQVLFVCTKEQLTERFMRFPWNTAIKASFAVHTLGDVGAKGSELAPLIWRSLEKPRVELSRPEADVWAVRFKERIVVSRLIWSNSKDYLLRKPQCRPRPSPVSLSPKLARACVNLLGLRKGTVCDPFCGSGGILIEAALMGLRAVGYDSSERMLSDARCNLEHFGVTAVLFHRDARRLMKKHRLVVTDLPYGRSSQVEEGLYEDFFARLRVVRAAAVVMLPDSADWKGLAGRAGLAVVETYQQYVHRSLTKRILVLRTR